MLRRLFASSGGSRAQRVAWLLRGPSPVYLGDHTILVRTVHGFKLFVDSRDVSLAPHIIMDGIWERSVTRFIERRVHEDMRVVEVGANVGFHSLHLSQRIGPRGVIACFEANERLAKLLEQSVEVNGLKARSIICPYAVTDRLGQLEFNIFHRHMGASSLIASQGAADEYHDNITRVTVPSTTLDAACSDWPHINFIKIDAEGAEPLVLAGAKALLARSPDVEILLEFGPAFWPSVEDARAFLEGVQQDGFRIRRLGPEGTSDPVAIPDLLDPTKLAELVLSRGSRAD